MTSMSKAYNITREEVDASWKAVCRSGGCAGYDGKTIEDVKADEDNILYKVWNRLASGSYQAQPVLLVQIPKAKGGVRTLGIPTVTDRIAQGVIKGRLEKEVQEKFHPNSYAYQTGKSAIEAVGTARERCMKGGYKWVLDLDIKAFFDEIDHELMAEMVNKHTEDKAVILYCKKFMKAEGITEAGEKVVREKGTPQGGVLSPVLANLFLHEVFDMWMEENHPHTPFERYADDIIIHCVREDQAYQLLEEIKKRLKEYKLELNLEKTKVVYTGTDNSQDHRGHGCSRKFTFLGYDFKPRGYKGKIVFTPGMGNKAMQMIRQKLKREKLNSRVGQRIEEIAEMLNQKIRGWINYYGQYRRSELWKLAYYINYRLVKWLKSKYNSILSLTDAWKELAKVKDQAPRLFCHWYMIG